LLRMLKGSPDVYLSGPIKKYITDRGGRYGDRPLFLVDFL
jgi:zeta-carotene desaturase